MTAKTLFVCLLWFFVSWVTSDVLQKKLATKTPYAYVQNNDTANVRPRESCEPVQLWFLVRHGTRYPKPLGIVYIRDRVHEIARQIVDNIQRSPRSVRLNQTQVERLLSWRASFDENKNDKKLHPEGEREMILLAERTQARFPHLLSQGL